MSRGQNFVPATRFFMKIERSHDGICPRDMSLQHVPSCEPTLKVQWKAACPIWSSYVISHLNDAWRWGYRDEQKMPACKEFPTWYLTRFKLNFGLVQDSFRQVALKCRLSEGQAETLTIAERADPFTSKSDQYFKFPLQPDTRNTTFTRYENVVFHNLQYIRWKIIMLSILTTSLGEGTFFIRGGWGILGVLSFLKSWPSPLASKRKAWPLTKYHLKMCVSP